MALSSETAFGVLAATAVKVEYTRAILSHSSICFPTVTLSLTRFGARPASLDLSSRASSDGEDSAKSNFASESRDGAPPCLNAR